MNNANLDNIVQISEIADLIIAAQFVVIKNIGIDVMLATTDTEDFNRIFNQYHI